MKRIAVVLCVVFCASLVGYGQQYSETGRAWRTITNDDLESVRAKRLKAEKEYKENYEKMGFPSPEELDRQRDADMSLRVRLADQLRQARLEKERIDLERERIELDAVRMASERQEREEAVDYSETTYLGGYNDYDYGAYGYGSYGYGGYNVGYPYGRYFPKYRTFPGFRRNRLYPVRGYPTYRATPFGTLSTGTVQFSGLRFFGGASIIGFPGR